MKLEISKSLLWEYPPKLKTLDNDNYGLSYAAMLFNNKKRP